MDLKSAQHLAFCRHVERGVSACSFAKMRTFVHLLMGNRHRPLDGTIRTTNHLDRNISEAMVELSSAYEGQFSQNEQ